MSYFQSSGQIFEKQRFVHRKTKLPLCTTEWEGAINAHVSVSEQTALSFSRWKAIYQLCRSLDFNTHGWRDLVNHGTANWFPCLYLQNLARGRGKFHSPGRWLNVIFPLCSSTYHLFSIFLAWHLGECVRCVKHTTAKSGGLKDFLW